MINFNVPVTVYKLEELSDSARQYAIDEHRSFLLDEMQPSDFISGDPEYDTPEMLQEVFESEYEAYATDDDIIIESIEANEYMFFDNGKIANVCHYCKNHPTRPDQTWINYHGTEYRIA